MQILFRDVPGGTEEKHLNLGQYKRASLCREILEF